MELAFDRQLAATRSRQAYLAGGDAMRLILNVDGTVRGRDIRKGSQAVSDYRALKNHLGMATSPGEEKLFGYAQDTLTVSGLVFSAIALPKMAQKTATSFRELTTLVHAPTATMDQRLDKVEEVGRAAAGTVFASQGVVLGAKGTLGILSRNSGVASVVSSVGKSRAMGFLSTPLGMAFKVLLPIADFAVFGADVISMRRALNDPTQTASDKFRKALNLGLSGLKVSFWIFPQVRALRAAYSVASTVQLGLMFREFSAQLVPAAKSGIKTLGNAVLHPVETTKAVGSAIVNGTKSVLSAGASLVGWTASKLVHPIETWNTFATEFSTWKNALLNRNAQPAPAPTMQTAPTAPAPTMPVAPAAPVYTAPVYTAPATSVTGVPVAPVAPAPVAPVAPVTDASYEQAMAQLDVLAAQTAPAPTY